MNTTEPLPGGGRGTVTPLLSENLTIFLPAAQLITTAKNKILMIGTVRACKEFHARFACHSH